MSPFKKSPCVSKTSDRKLACMPSSLRKSARLAPSLRWGKLLALARPQDLRLPYGIARASTTTGEDKRRTKR